MDGFDKLELSTETLRELSTDEMKQVAGGTLGISRTCLIIIPPTILVDAVTQQVSVGCA